MGRPIPGGQAGLYALQRPVTGSVLPPLGPQVIPREDSAESWPPDSPAAEGRSPSVLKGGREVEVAITACTAGGVHRRGAWPLLPERPPLPHQYCGGVVWFWPQRALYQNTALSEDSWIVGQEKMPALLRALGLIHGGQGRTPRLPLVTPTAGVCWCRWAGLGATQPLPLWPQGSSVRVRRGHRQIGRASCREKV